MLPRMGALLDVLGDWYIEAIEKAEASAPETQVGQISAGLVSRLATEPELDLPEDWRRELSELAGDRTLVLVAEAREHPTRGEVAHLYQSLSRDAPDELQRLLRTVTQHVLEHRTLPQHHAASVKAIAHWLVDHLAGGVLSHLAFKELEDVAGKMVDAASEVADAAADVS
jgi:hypothetical protein